ncbi:MAG: transposase family protein, partial [Bifidobacteriaceae bacterium]|nr:transposase family protein [Bifidobacteriaceae bacterium]
RSEAAHPGTSPAAPAAGAEAAARAGASGGRDTRHARSARAPDRAGGGRVAEARAMRAAGSTFALIGDHFGVHASTVSRWINPPRRPGAGTEEEPP